MASSIARRAAPESDYRVGQDSSPHWIVRQAAKARDAARARSQSQPTLANASAASRSAYVSAPVAATHDETQESHSFSSSLLFIAAFLILGGLIMAYSASQLTSEITTGDPNALFLQQLVRAALGCLLALAAALAPLDFIRRYAWHFMAFSVLLLVLVPLIGHTAFGAQRWLIIGNTTFQPSELAKLALVIFFADWLTLKGEQVKTIKKGLIPFWVITAFVVVLIWAENDLGTIVVVFIVAAAMFFVSGARMIQLLPVALIGAAGVALITLITPFRRARIEAFLHPLSPGCSDNTSYHVCHAVVSLMSGGFFGRGLGDGLAKASYLPNAATDSIFAVVGEELGLVGCCAVLAGFLALAFIGFRIGRRSQNAFDALLAVGITSWLLFQAALNIGSVVSVIPFTGVPLPFFSIGGSSLVISLVAIGLLLNLSRRTMRREVAA